MWLIGMMGSGKTSIGGEVAARLGVPFYDTDDLVVEMSRMSISAIWEGVGEEGFRELERRAVAAVPVSGFVAAAGGGAVLDAGSREHMREGAPVIWLRSSPAHLADRLAGDGTRPLLATATETTEERLTGILSERADLYAEVATDVLDTDGREIEDLIHDVVAIWRS